MSEISTVRDILACAGAFVRYGSHRVVTAELAATTGQRCGGWAVARLRPECPLPRAFRKSHFGAFRAGFDPSRTWGWYPFQGGWSPFKADCVPFLARRVRCRY
jgi:hypothetical protein